MRLLIKQFLGRHTKKLPVRIAIKNKEIIFILFRSRPRKILKFLFLFYSRSRLNFYSSFRSVELI